MIPRDFLYVSALSSIVSLSGCKSTLPPLQDHEKRAELEGTYNGKVDEIEVTYTVEKDECMMQFYSIEPFTGGVEIKNIVLLDTECDNLFDYAPNKYGFVGNREYFQKHFPEEVERFDRLLERGQKLVRLENKVKE